MFDNCSKVKENLKHEEDHLSMFTYINCSVVTVV